MTSRKMTTDEKPVVVRLSPRTIASFFATQIVFCVSLVWTASTWASNMRSDIDEVSRENVRQNAAMANLTAALEKVADNSNQTARTLERVMGRLEAEENR